MLTNYSALFPELLAFQSEIFYADFYFYYVKIVVIRKIPICFIIFYVIR